MSKKSKLILAIDRHTRAQIALSRLVEKRPEDRKAFRKEGKASAAHLAKAIKEVL